MTFALFRTHGTGHDMIKLYKLFDDIEDECIVQCQGQT